MSEQITNVAEVQSSGFRTDEIKVFCIFIMVAAVTRIPLSQVQREDN